MDAIKREDPELAALMEREFDRQRRNLELIASENIVSPAVLEAAGSILTNKYAEGYPGRRYYGGCQYVDSIETLAVERAKNLFGAEHANVQPHAGSQANMAAYIGLGLKPGDTVLSLNLDSGGHLTHGSGVNFSGRLYNFVYYRLDENGLIDMEHVRAMAKKYRPKLILAGTSAYSRLIDYKAFRAIADEVGARLMADMAHIAGLVAAGLIPSPVPYADVVTSTTHKTLRGPRGGLILCRAELAKAIDSAVFPGTQGGPLEHIIAAKAVCFREAQTDAFRAYQARILRNAKALAGALLELGLSLVSGGTDNHLMLLDLRGTGVSGRELQERLDEVHITANKNSVPGDPLSPFVTSGLRLGTPAVTSRGLDEADMRQIAGLLHDSIFDYAATAQRTRAAVAALCDAHPIYS